MSQKLISNCLAGKIVFFKYLDVIRNLLGKLALLYISANFISTDIVETAQHFNVKIISKYL